MDRNPDRCFTLRIHVQPFFILVLMNRNDILERLLRDVFVEANCVCYIQT